MTHVTFFKIFDSKVQPVLLYILLKFRDYKDLKTLRKKINLMACKRFLGVPVRTPSKMVYGNLGRFPLYEVM